MLISVMITTKNRVEDLKRTCRVLCKIDPPPLEILITADGCTDGTVEFVRSELPQARLIVNTVGQGSVASRDRMMREAAGDLVLALDDDSYPEQSDCLTHLANLFVDRPQLAVAHFPQHYCAQTLDRIASPGLLLTRAPVCVVQFISNSQDLSHASFTCMKNQTMACSVLPVGLRSITLPLLPSGTIGRARHAVRSRTIIVTREMNCGAL